MTRQYEQMATFAKVVEAGSFTRAAEMLGLPKSTVSTHVSKLESRLGVQLLQRSTRSLHLTQAGSCYYQHCARMVEVADQAITEISEMQERPAGVLRITAPVNYGTVILSTLSVEFLERHSALRIELLLLDRVVDLIEEGVDLAFRLGPLRDSNLIARRLRPIRHHLCATPGYVERFSAPASPEDLRNHRCLLSGPRSTWVFEGAGERKTLHLDGRLSINNQQGVKNAALAGLGIVRLPGYMCSEELRSGRFVPILADWPEPPTENHVIYANTRHVPLKVRCFLDYVLERLA
jgi:DNA-binding transcriptional LysR family regulator